MPNTSAWQHSCACMTLTAEEAGDPLPDVWFPA